MTKREHRERAAAEAARCGVEAEHEALRAALATHRERVDAETRDDTFAVRKARYASWAGAVRPAIDALADAVRAAGWPHEACTEIVIGERAAQGV